jgi:predicted Rdx family selenoprotein
VYSALLGVVALGCGSSADDAATTASSSSTTTSSTTLSSTVTAEPPTDAPQTSTEAVAATEAPASQAGPYRVAPVGDELAVLRWTPQQVWQPSHTGDWAEVATGPVSEVAQVPDWGVVFQRTTPSRVIWTETNDGPKELVVASESQQLTLEGAGLNANGEPIVLYQRHESGSPEETRSSLRSFNIETGVVEEIVETGAWEAGVSFAHISGQAAVVGYWSSEATTGNAIVDLAISGQLIWDLVDDGCFDGEPSCIVYEHATVVDGEIVGGRPIWNEEAGWVDQFGLFSYDPENDAERLIAAFPWDNGLWYVENIFEFGGDSVVLSLSDSPRSGGNPLPPLVVALNSGHAFTMPEATFVRPAWLS